MTALLDRPSQDELRLLQIIAEGWLGAGERWPFWQYVTVRLSQEGLNAEELYRGLPAWQHGYRSVFGASSVVPIESDRVGLTVHGMVHVPHPATDSLVSAFLHALAGAIETIKTIAVDPSQIVFMRYPLADIMQRSGLFSTRPPDDEALMAVLQHEPATWLGVHGGQAMDELPYWNLSEARLQSFAGVATGTEYLTRLEAIIGVLERDTRQVILSPMALPEALDHLDLAWRLYAGGKQRLVKISRATVAAQLTQPVNSAADFQARCSALGELISCFDVQKNPSDGDRGPLLRLLADLERRAGVKLSSVFEAVKILLNVIDVRTHHQHGPGHKADRVARSWVDLGLAPLEGDWATAWHRISVLTVESLAAIREVMVRIVDGTLPVESSSEVADLTKDADPSH